jgi:hypothetical protein
MAPQRVHSGSSMAVTDVHIELFMMASFIAVHNKQLCHFYHSGSAYLRPLGTKASKGDVAQQLLVWRCMPRARITEQFCCDTVCANHQSRRKCSSAQLPGQRGFAKALLDSSGEWWICP